MITVAITEDGQFLDEIESTMPMSSLATAP
jgi:hypothetical protein